MNEGRALGPWAEGVASSLSDYVSILIGNGDGILRDNLGQDISAKVQFLAPDHL